MEPGALSCQHLTGCQQRDKQHQSARSPKAVLNRTTGQWDTEVSAEISIRLGWRIRVMYRRCSAPSVRFLPKMLESCDNQAGEMEPYEGVGLWLAYDDDTLYLSQQLIRGE